MTAAELMTATVIMGAITIIVVTMVWFSNHLNRRRYAPLIERFGFSHIRDRRDRILPEEIEGDWQGGRVNIRYRPGSRSESNSVTFTYFPATRLPVPGKVLVRRKRLIDHVAVAIGLARRLWKRRYSESGRAFVEADNDDYAESLVRMLDFRHAVLPLIDYQRPFLSIEADRISLVLKGPFLFVGRKLEPQHVDKVLHGLRTLSELNFPAHRSVVSEEKDDEQPHDLLGTVNQRLRRSPLAPVLFPLTISASALLFIGPLMLWWGSRYPALTWDLYLFGLAFGGGLVVLYALLMFSAIRGHSQSISEFSTLMFFAIVGFPTFCIGVLVVANGFADPGTARQIEGRVIDKRDKELIASVRLDDGRRGEVRVSVPMDVYRRSRDGDPVRVTVKPGRLNQPWHVSSTVDTP